MSAAVPAAAEPPPLIGVPAQAGPRDDAPSAPPGALPGPLDVAPSAATGALPGPLDVAPATGTGAPAPSGTWPCSCGGRTSLDQDVCASCGAAFLADLRDGPPALVVPGVGDLVALSSAARAGLAFTVVLCFLAVFASVCLLLS